LKHITIILLISFCSILSSLSEDTANSFIEALINVSPDLENYVSQEELAKSSRLGIEYKNVRHKWLISYELEGELNDYKFEIEDLEDDFSKFALTNSSNTSKKEYFFHKDKFISPLTFYTKDWQVLQTEFIDFYFSDPIFFHRESADRLNDFIKKTAGILVFSDAEIQTLQTNKINYIYCRDNSEIEKITGYNARGMLNLASDSVVSTFSCHYHELVHLLINFKLRELNLYTHPFLLEGAAVALGGRGGKEPKIITDMGFFLEKSEFISYGDLLSSEGFYINDASLSYPVSGLYIGFLLEEIGAEAFMNLYRKYSSNVPVQNRILHSDLPSERKWKAFLKDYNSMENIEFTSKIDFPEIISDGAITVSKTQSGYFFKTNRNRILIYDDEPETEYKSKKFTKLFPNEEYEGAKFLITLDDAEINVYNLFTNNLVACYVTGFSVTQVSIKKEEGRFMFIVLHEIFGACEGIELQNTVMKDIRLKMK
jgi:hypothetical protein